MGKSIRSKIKKKHRAKRREEIYKPVEDERRYRSLMNLARAQHSQSASSESVDALKAMLGSTDDSAAVVGKTPEETEPQKIEAGARLVADAIPALKEHSEKIAQAERRAEEEKNDHFSFLEKEEVPAWKVVSRRDEKLSKRG